MISFSFFPITLIFLMLCFMSLIALMSYCNSISFLLHKAKVTGEGVRPVLCNFEGGSAVLLYGCIRGRRNFKNLA